MNQNQIQPPDHYHLDLARRTLVEAEEKLVATQHYLRDAGLPAQIPITQQSIEQCRAQRDNLMRLSQQAAQ